MTPIESAINIALDAYKGVTDKQGQPIILHAMRVAASVNDETNGDEIATIVGLLHDVLEIDNGYSYSILKEEVGEEIADCVELLACKEKDKYFTEYLPNVKKNNICRQVKISDLDDNTRNWRLDKLPEETSSRLKEKYSRAWKYLVNSEEQPESL